MGGEQSGSREEVTRKFYNKLTVLPSNRTLIISLTIILLIPALVIYAYTRSHGHIIGYLVGGLMYALLLQLLLSWRKPFSMRRALGLAVYSLGIGLIVDLLALPSGLHGFVFTSSSGIVFIALVGLVSGLGFAVLFSVVVSFLSYIVYSLFTGLYLKEVLANTMVLAICLGVHVSYLRLVKAKGKAWGLDPLKLTRAFLANWLSNIAEPMENILSSLSIPQKARIDVIVFKRENTRPIALIVPEIHYGPFKNVGSSMMPYFLDEAFTAKGYNALALHGPEAHKHNLPTAEYSRKIAWRIAEELSRSHGMILRPREFFREKAGEWEALVVPFDKTALLFVTRDKGIDDLPSKLRDIAEKLREEKGVYPVIVDSHNSYTSEEFNGMEVEALLRRVVEKTLFMKECKFKIGYGEAKVQASDRYGLCNGRIRSLVFECDGKKIGITYIYGNNMFPETRIKLKQLVAEKQLLDDYEPITPDDHTCTATLADHPYVPVRYSDELARAVLESLEKALSDLKETKVFYHRIIVDKVRFVGNAIYDMLGLLEEVGGFVERTINIEFILNLVLQLLAIYLISFLA